MGYCVVMCHRVNGRTVKHTRVRNNWMGSHMGGKRGTETGTKWSIVFRPLSVASVVNQCFLSLFATALPPPPRRSEKPSFGQN